MTDNELIVKLQDDVIAAINNSPMPLAVKGIVLENMLLRIKMQMEESTQTAARVDDPAADIEATEALAEQAVEEGADNG